MKQHYRILRDMWINLRTLNSIWFASLKAASFSAVVLTCAEALPAQPVGATLGTARCDQATNVLLYRELDPITTELRNRVLTTPLSWIELRNHLQIINSGGPEVTQEDLSLSAAFLWLPSRIGLGPGGVDVRDPTAPPAPSMVDWDIIKREVQFARGRGSIRWQILFEASRAFATRMGKLPRAQEIWHVYKGTPAASAFRFKLVDAHPMEKSNARSYLNVRLDPSLLPNSTNNLVRTRVRVIAQLSLALDGLVPSVITYEPRSDSDLWNVGFVRPDGVLQDYTTSIDMALRSIAWQNANATLGQAEPKASAAFIDNMVLEIMTLVSDSRVRRF